MARRRGNKPFRTFTFSESIKYGKKGKVNTFNYFGKPVKIFVSLDGKRLEILDAPKSIRDKLKKAEEVIPYKDRLHVRYPKEPAKIKREKKTKPADTLPRLMDKRSWTRAFQKARKTQQKLGADGWTVQRGSLTEGQADRTAQDLEGLGYDTKRIPMGVLNGEIVEFVAYKPKPGAAPKPKPSSWEEIPRMEGFLFEINQALSGALLAIAVCTQHGGTVNYHLAIKYIKRFKALVKPSGIFDEIRPPDKPMYSDLEKFIEIAVFSRCDKIVKHLEKAKEGSNLDLEKVLWEFSSLVCITIEYYMYAKTKFCFTGSYKPAYDVYDQEGIE